MNALHDLPIIKNQTAFNLARWAELCADPLWVDVEGKIETDRYGQIILTPPADPVHGGRQADLTLLLSKFAPAGKIIVECPVSTGEGVKVPDLVWASKKRFATVGSKKSALTAAPEICVEVLSPSNTRNEIEEKRRLYFAAEPVKSGYANATATSAFSSKRPLPERRRNRRSSPKCRA